MQSTTQLTQNNTTNENVQLIANFISILETKMSRQIFAYWERNEKLKLAIKALPLNKAVQVLFKVVRSSNDIIQNSNFINQYIQWYDDANIINVVLTETKESCKGKQPTTYKQTLINLLEKRYAAIPKKSDANPIEFADNTKNIEDYDAIADFKSDLKACSVQYVRDKFPWNEKLQNAIRSLSNYESEKLLIAVINNGNNNISFLKQYLIWLNNPDVINAVLDEIKQNHNGKPLSAYKKRRIKVFDDYQAGIIQNNTVDLPSQTNEIQTSNVSTDESTEITQSKKRVASPELEENNRKKQKTENTKNVKKIGDYFPRGSFDSSYFEDNYSIDTDESIKAIQAIVTDCPYTLFTPSYQSQNPLNQNSPNQKDNEVNNLSLT